MIRPEPRAHDRPEPAAELRIPEALEVEARIDAPPAGRVAPHRRYVLPERVEARHLANVHTAAGGEFDVPPRPGIDLEDLVEAIARVELEFGAEDSAITDCLQELADRVGCGRDPLDGDRQRRRAVAELPRKNP